MNEPTRLGRRAACAALLGMGGSLVLAGRVQAQEQPQKTARQKGAKGVRRPKTPPSFKNGDFYSVDGKFNEQAAKDACFALCKHFGYPLNDRVLKEIFVTDFGLGQFTEVGLGCVVWVDDKTSNYASLEVFLLPNQMIPEHWHVAIESEGVAPKMEGWTVRYGSTFAYGEGEPTKDIAVKIPACQTKFVTAMKEARLRPGEYVGVSKPMEKHWQQAGPEGCILTETSTYHSGAAVRFTDPKIKF